MRLSIKVDVDTYRGTLEGVPNLCRVLKKRGIPATFLFSLGPDNTGKALRRIFRKGFLSKCLRSNVAGNYGLKTLLYGTLLKAPRIGKLCADQMKSARDGGFECGIHCWDHFKWQDCLSSMRPTEIGDEFEKARAEFEKIFGYEPKSCGAPGWQITPDALETEDKAGMLYASDTRGTCPFMPAMGGRKFNTLQIPSTLPTLDEVLGITPVSELSDTYLAKISQSRHSVVTVHAELEGMAYLEWFDAFLSKLKSSGTEFIRLDDYAKEILKKPESIPDAEIKMEPFPGRSGTLAVQCGGAPKERKF